MNFMFIYIEREREKKERERGRKGWLTKMVQGSREGERGEESNRDGETGRERGREGERERERERGSEGGRERERGLEISTWRGGLFRFSGFRSLRGFWSKRHTGGRSCFSNRDS